MTNELTAAPPAKSARTKFPLFKRLVLIMLVGLAAFHGGTANAEEDFYVNED